MTNPNGDALWTVATNICGDGLVVGEEICDNADKVLGDGIKCLDDCSGSHPGWTCTGGSTTTPSVCESTCGDGVVVFGEQCDDGDNDSLDGCSDTCI